MNSVSKRAKSIAILGTSSAMLLVATLLPAASGLELTISSTVEVEAPQVASIVEPETAASLFSEDDLSATASGVIFSTQMALVSAVSRLIDEYGFNERQYNCLNELWTQESNWNYKSRNKVSGAHGIPQALPASKMNIISTDWRTNPVTQIRWGLRYISIRYETPCKAWAKHKRSNWY
jgi:hypothetical protein